MKVNGKSKTPITAAQSKEQNGEEGGTKARASQQAAKRKKNRVETAVLERISDGILALDAGMNYTYLNERAGELLGLSEADLIGKNPGEERDGAHRIPFMEACQRALETQSVVWLSEYFPPTGRWLEGQAYPSQDGVSVLFREGAGRIAEEDRIRMLSVFPEQDPAPVMRLTQQAEILYANPAAAPLLANGTRLGKLAGSLLKIGEILPQVIQSQTIGEIEIENDGLVFACQLVPITGEGHANLYFRDITGPKRNEQALRESEERFTRFMHHLPGLAWIKDAQDRYVFANAAAQKAFNASQEDIYGKTDWEIFPQEVAEQFNRNDDLALREEKGMQVVEMLPQPDGVVHHSLVTKFPIPGPDGRPAWIGGTAIDISERVQMEAALRMARAQAENTAYRMAQLQRTTAALSQIITPAEIARIVVEQGASIVGAAGGSIMLLDEESQTMDLIFSSIPESVVPPLIRFPLSLDTPSADAVRSVDTIWITSRAEYLQRYPHLAENIRDWGYEAALVVPMVYKRKVLGTLSLSFSQPLPLSMDDQEYLLTLARQAAQAFERARVETAVRLDAAMMENVPAGVYLVHSSDGTILHTNRQLDTLFGYEPGELIGKPVSVLNAGNIHSPQDVVDEIVDTLREEGSWRGEILSRRKDGTTFWCYASITIFEHDTHGTVWVTARQDITERKQIEEALGDSEQRYRAIVSQATAGIVRKDQSGRLLFVNQAFCDMLGMSESELKGRRIWELTHHEDVRENKRLYNRLMSEGIPFQLEERMINKHGAILWVNVSVSPVVDVSGKPRSAVSVYVDITGRKLAEEALYQLNSELEERVRRRTIELQAANEFLRASEATSRLILESMPDAIVIIDRDGQIVHANTRVESLFGYSPEEVIGRPVEILVPKRRHSQHEQNRLLHEDQHDRRTMGLGHELFGRRKDASEFPVEVLYAAIDNSANWDALVAIRDNTRQRQAREALRLNEEKLRTLFEILPVGISFLGKDGRVNELNTALTEILDMPRNEILAGNYKARRFIRADGSPMPPSEFASSRTRQEQKTIYNVETGIVKENGGIIWTSVNAAPVQVADVEAAVVTIDITGRKNNEEALHKNRERLKILTRRLVEVQEEERRAIARELHDRVGQNLAALTLNLNILRSLLSADSMEKIGTRLDDSVNLVKDILVSIRNVMADLRPNVLDDYGLDAALNEYAERFTQRYGIRVITNTPARPTQRLDPGVEMTLLRIAQEALTNIARHAQATQAVMTLKVEKDDVLMMVEDNGQGILSWQRVNQPGSHGLRIMHERAEAFGGAIKIRSAHRNGTTIEVKIPLSNSAPENAARRKDHDHGHPGR